MKIFAIGDPHLSFDERIEKPMDVFGAGWKDHSGRLKEKWEAVVSPEDIVLILGDISWGLRLDEAMADLTWIHELPGKKVITKGNHDLWWVSTNKLNTLFDDVTFLQNHCYMVGAGNGGSGQEKSLSDRGSKGLDGGMEGGGLAICGTRGWICPGTQGFDDHDNKIYEREQLRLRMSLDDAREHGAGEIICCLHYPPTNDKFQSSGFTQLMTEYKVKQCLYGHLHGKEAFKNGFQGQWNGTRYRLVSLDYVGCEPQLVKEI